MKKLKVEVTAHDIKTGKRGKVFCCPIAKAVKRATNYKKRGRVDGLSVEFTNPNEHARLPAVAEKFVNNFDAGLKVKPISFTLKIKPDQNPLDDEDSSCPYSW